MSSFQKMMLTDIESFFIKIFCNKNSLRLKAGKKRWRPSGKNKASSPKKVKVTPKVKVVVKKELVHSKATCEDMQTSDDNCSDASSVLDMASETSSENEFDLDQQTEAQQSVDAPNEQVPEILGLATVSKEIDCEVRRLWTIFSDVEDRNAQVTWAHGFCMTLNELRRLLCPSGRQAWLNDQVLSMFAALVNAHAQNTKSYVFSPLLFPIICRDLKLGSDKSTSRWITKSLQKSGLLNLDGICDQTRLLLFPMCLEHKDHWVLGVIDVANSEAFVVNPFHTAKSNAVEMKIIKDLVGLLQSFKKPLSLHRFKFTFPETNAYPLTQQMDGYNCGVYVCLYILHFAFDEFVEPVVCPNKLRIWMVYWMIKSSIPQNALSIAFNN